MKTMVNALAFFQNVQAYFQTAYFQNAQAYFQMYFQAYFQEITANSKKCRVRQSVAATSSQPTKHAEQRRLHACRIVLATVQRNLAGPTPPARSYLAGRWPCLFLFLPNGT